MRIVSKLLVSFYRRHDAEFLMFDPQPSISNLLEKPLFRRECLLEFGVSCSALTNRQIARFHPESIELPLQAVLSQSSDRTSAPQQDYWVIPSEPTKWDG